MADDTTASVIPLHQVPQKKDKPGTKRARTYRSRRKPKTEAVTTAEAELLSSDFLIPPEFLTPDGEISEPPPTQLPATSSLECVEPAAVATDRNAPVTPSRPHLAPVVLSIAAVGLGAVGITINGWFARSLGSSAVAGWLFLAIGVAADLVALVMPSCAAGLWQAGQRATALGGWTVWLVTFLFAVTAGIGFASTNISDVSLARASRVTPAVTMAQAALTDAMVARDRECKGGVGKFCREREAAVAERRQILDTAMLSVGQSTDPQTDAAVKLVSWVSDGLLRPGAEDFAMLRLILLALLPQIGGILIMVGRHAARPMPVPTLAW
jgi:hypothetical protein